MIICACTCRNFGRQLRAEAEAFPEQSPGEIVQRLRRPRRCSYRLPLPSLDVVMKASLTIRGSEPLARLFELPTSECSRNRIQAGRHELLGLVLGTMACPDFPIFTAVITDDARWPWHDEHCR